MELEKYRKLFPVTLQKVYLNHAAISPFSIRVTERLEWFLDERSFGEIDAFQKANEIRNRLRVNLAELINANPQNIAFITNTSEGFNHLTQGLDWEEGDEIILFDCEFPSNIYPFLNLEKRKGVKIKFVPAPGGIIDLDSIKKAITPRTRLLSISYVEFLSGFKNDLKAIGTICKENEIIFSVDSIQGLGALPLDVRACHIDFLSNGGHKWLMGPMGAGFMYISPQLFKKLKPAYTGWLAVENAWDFLDYQLDFLPEARRYEFGTANFMGLVGLSASVELLKEVGLTNIHSHLLEIGEFLVEELTKLGMRFVNSMDRTHWAGIYSFAGDDVEALFQSLKEKNIICSMRNGLLRIAPHFYNTREEIETLVQEVEKFYRIKS